MLFRSVVERKIAVAAGAYYMGTSLDETRFWLYGMPAPDVTLEDLDRAVGEVIAEVVKNGVEPADLVRAKTRLIADAVYAQDSQTALARWYGAALTTGSTITDIQEWPARIDAVTADAVKAACAKWLEPKRAVTGFLLPEKKAEAA